MLSVSLEAEGGVKGESERIDPKVEGRSAPEVGVNTNAHVKHVPNLGLTRHGRHPDSGQSLQGSPCPSLSSRYMGLLTTPQTHHTCTNLRAFALAVLPAWNIFPHVCPGIPPHPIFKSLLKTQFLRGRLLLTTRSLN